MVTADRANIYADPRSVGSVEECDFYHWMEIPGHGLVEGEWDLRGGEGEYLGGIELRGKRVLEIGPASGFLTFHMESQGAGVVAVELGGGGELDLVPGADLADGVDRDEAEARLARIRSGFWFAHERHRSDAKVHYGSAYDLPSELGRFDVAVVAAVLLHTRDPLRVVEECTRVADGIVIVDRRDLEIQGLPVAKFVPSPDSPQPWTWWHLSPELLVRFLSLLGFRSTVSYHDQRFESKGWERRIPMFTVVATR